MNGGPKDNANPVIRNVESRRHSSKRPVGWRELQTFVVGNGGVEEETTAFDIENLVPSASEGVNPITRSRVDQTVLKALSDVSRATNGEGVGLLKRVGWKIPTEVSPESLISDPLLYSTLDAADNNNPAAMEVDGEEESKRDRLDAEEIFDIIRNIQDPEHPLTLEQLGVVSCDQIEVRDVLDSPSEADDGSFVDVRFTPTIPGCSMATLIGLAIKVKLQRSLPPRFKVAVRIERGTHQSEHSINKQLADKERVCAALENPHLFKVVNRCIHNGMTGNMS
jgi:metal-sulfur cluster biosynthetic enzyme